MKKCIQIMIVAGAAACGHAQEIREAAWTGEATPAPLEVGSPWNISGGLIYKNNLYEHDALQQRQPEANDGARVWEDGDTDGSGWGLQARIGRGDGALNVIFIKSDFTYQLNLDGGGHQIDTVTREFELSWSQIRGRNDQATWGSTLGFRYLGAQKDVEVRERSTVVTGSDNINWLMLVGGYDGHWRPFETDLFTARGAVRFMLGEVKGLARSGFDDNWSDGAIAETYANEYSLAYGASASFGIDVALTKDVRITLDYKREWLYSFDATDTGIVVFPDNSDALFIENQHAVLGSISYIF